MVNSPPSQVLAAEALRTLLQGAPASLLHACSGLAGPLLAVARRPGQSDDAAPLAVEVLGCLSSCAEAAGQLLDEGLVPLLVDMMARDGSASGAGGTSLRQLRSRSAVHSYGGARRHGDKAVFAAFCLAAHQRALPRLRVAGAVPRLAAHLRGGTLQTQAHAAGALMYLSISAEGRPAVVAAGAIEPLIALLSSDSPAGQAHAANALGCLGEDSRVAGTVGAKGGVVALARMLSCSDPRLQEAAVGCLAPVARRSPSNQRRLLDAGGLGRLLAVLRERRVEPFALTAAAATLGELAAHRGVRSAVMASEEAMGALRSLSRHPDADTAAAARRAINAVVEYGLLAEEPFPMMLLP